IQSLGWDDFVAALDEERTRVGPIRLPEHFPDRRGSNSKHIVPTGLQRLHRGTPDPEFRSCVRDSVIEHKHEGFRGVHVRLKLGDITSAPARQLAEVARRFSANQLRVSTGQNIYLPWVREEGLVDLYRELKRIELG